MCDGVLLLSVVGTAVCKLKKTTARTEVWRIY
jgi:hypothetical protein